MTSVPAIRQLQTLALALVVTASGCDRTGLRPIETDDSADSDSTDTDDSDLPPPVCDPFERAASDVDTVVCRVPFGSYTFTESWRFPLSLYYTPDNFGSPLVAHVDDDNGDGLVGSGDVPEVLFQPRRFLGFEDSGLYVLDSVTGEQKAHWKEAAAFAYVDTGPGRGPISFVAPGVILGDVRDPASQFTVPDVPVDRQPGCHPRYSSLGEVDGDGFVDLLRDHGWYSPQNETGWSLQGYGWGNGRSDRCLSLPIWNNDSVPARVVSGRHIYRGDGSIHCQVEGVEDGFSLPADYDGDLKTEILLLTWSGVTLFDEDCAVIHHRPDLSITEEGQLITLRVAPLLDTTGTDVYIGLYVDPGDGSPRRFHFAILDHTLKITPTELPAGGGEVVDLDGDGLYEVFLGRDLWDPRTGEVIASLPVGAEENAIVKAWVADIDADDQAEVMAVVCPLGRCYPTDGVPDGHLIVFEGDGFAPAPRVRRNDVVYRAGEMLENGRFVPAGEYPPYSAYNTINVPSFSPAWHGFGATLNAHFDRVCTTECDRDRLVVSVSLSNSGTVDVMRPVDLILTGEVEGTATALGRWSLPDGLAAGRQTEAWTLNLEGEASRATNLVLSIETPGWEAETCTPVEEASVAWAEELCD